MVQIKGFKELKKDELTALVKGAIKDLGYNDVDLASKTKLSMGSIRNYWYYQQASHKNLIRIASVLGIELLVITYTGEGDVLYFAKS